MDLGPETGLSKGTIYSGIGHAGLLLWVVVGDFFFAHTPPEVIEVTTVSMMTSDEFAAIQATAPAPSEVVSPEPAQEPVPEVVPEEPAPQPEPEPQQEPVIEPPPEVEPTVEPDPAPEQPEEVFVAPEEQPLPSTATSMRPKPRPADRVAPDPVAVPEETAPTEAVAVEATSDQPTETPEVVPEDQPEAVQEDTGDVIRTEATEEQDEPLGMTASIRPKAKPARAARPEPAAETATVPETNTASVDDALSALDDVPDEPAETTGGGSDTVAPLGPPLTGGEVGDVRAAIGGKWSLGSVSTDVMRTTIVVRVSFDQSGKPTDIKLLESDGPTQAATDVAFSTARSAIVRAYQDGGIPLPPDKYDTWKVLDLVFDPNGMRFR